MSERGPAATIFEFDGAWDAIDAHYQDRGWTDGLPIVPPTEAAVRELLRWTDRDPRELIGILPPRQGEATVEKIAANAVMAGCRPEYFPVVLAAIEALADVDFNLDSVQATTHPVTPLLVVNGPFGRRIGLHGGYNAFGQGFRANVTIGRAVRLVLMNIGGGLPGSGDRSTQGTPAKLAYCVAENEVENPVGAAARGGRLRARRQRGHGVRLRGPAQHPGPLQQHGTRRAAHGGRRHGPGRQQQSARPGLAAAVVRSRARGHRGPRRLQQASGEESSCSSTRASRSRASAPSTSGSRSSAGTSWTRPTPWFRSCTGPRTSA